MSFYYEKAQNILDRSGIKIDLQETVENFSRLLSLYHHRNTVEGISKNLCSMFSNKKTLLQMIQNHPLHNGNLQIVKKAKRHREIEMDVVDKVSDELREIAEKTILSTVDEYGRTYQEFMEYYLKDVPLVANINDIGCESLVDDDLLSDSGFDSEGCSNKSRDKFYRFNSCITYCNYDANEFLPESSASYITSSLKEIGSKTTFKGGEKKTRVVGKICKAFGVDKHERYESVYAKVTNAWSPMDEDVYFVLSGNPYDYLTMSFGPNWSSCQTIDKENDRKVKSDQHWSGCSANGTIGYMNDPSTLVFYMVKCKKDGEDVYEHPEFSNKIYRNLFSYQNGVLVQGRIYPQGNDGATDLYDEFRHMVQPIIAEMEGLTANLSDWKKIGKSYQHSGYFETNDYSNHYPDYEQSDSKFHGCNVSVYKPVFECGDIVHIGSGSYCMECGDNMNHDRSGYMTCCDCGYSASDNDDYVEFAF